MSLLETRALTKAFGGLTAVNDVDVEVQEGEVLGIIGANGSGKTTLLNLMSRIIPPSDGELLLDGVAYTRWPAHRLMHAGVTRTYQNLRLFHDLSVRENIQLGLSRNRSALQSTFTWRDERRVRSEAREVMAQMGIGEYADSIPRDLPYGTQRVVEIARALASRPRLVMLDEPFAGMSTTEAEAICQFLLGVRKETDLALVIVDHNVEVLTSVSERMIAMAEGRVIANGDPSAVLDDDAVVRSYVGADV